jgi:hypothetical protein
MGYKPQRAALKNLTAEWIMSRIQPPNDFRSEESPITWFGEMLVALDLGDFDRAAQSQRHLDRLGWRVNRNRSHHTSRQFARRERRDA